MEDAQSSLKPARDIVRRIESREGSSMIIDRALGKEVMTHAGIKFVLFILGGIHYVKSVEG